MFKDQKKKKGTCAWRPREPVVVQPSSFVCAFMVNERAPVGILRKLTQVLLILQGESGSTIPSFSCMMYHTSLISGPASVKSSFC